MLQSMAHTFRFRVSPINKIKHAYHYSHHIIPILNSIKKHKKTKHVTKQVEQVEKKLDNQNTTVTTSVHIPNNDFIIPRKFKDTDLLYDGCVYTDASVMHRIAGIGIWSEYYKLNNSGSLKGLIDINRAELGAIFIALLKLNYQGNVYILSDSITALQLINGSIDIYKFSLIAKCIQYMRDNWNGSIKFKKVKGHSGNIGNENADRLAHDGVINHYKRKQLYLPDDIFGKGKINSDVFDMKDILHAVKNINNM